MQNPLVHLKDVVILKRHMAIGIRYLLTSLAWPYLASIYCESTVRGEK